MIYGHIDSLDDFNNSQLKLRSGSTSNDTISIFQFKDRLFDRDTLFVQQYSINFLFVLKSYTILSKNTQSAFEMQAKEDFRNNIVEYFNKYSSFKIFKLIPENNQEDLKAYIDKNFRAILGKYYYNSNKELFCAIHTEDNRIQQQLETHFIFEKHILV